MERLELSEVVEIDIASSAVVPAPYFTYCISLNAFPVLPADKAISAPLMSREHISQPFFAEVAISESIDSISRSPSNCEKRE
jgi:hypothetical protein